MSTAYIIHCRNTSITQASEENLTCRLHNVKSCGDDTMILLYFKKYNQTPQGAMKGQLFDARTRTAHLPMIHDMIIFRFYPLCFLHHFPHPKLETCRLTMDDMAVHVPVSGELNSCQKDAPPSGRTDESRQKSMHFDSFLHVASNGNMGGVGRGCAGAVCL